MAGDGERDRGDASELAGLKSELPPQANTSTVIGAAGGRFVREKSNGFALVALKMAASSLCSCFTKRDFCSSCPLTELATPANSSWTLSFVCANLLVLLFVFG